MLGENQVKRLLKQCENIDKAFSESRVPERMKEKQDTNKGWCEALRLVLEKNTYPISNKPID
jgi:hypothetical protein